MTDVDDNAWLDIWVEWCYWDYEDDGGDKERVVSKEEMMCIVVGLMLEIMLLISMWDVGWSCMEWEV